MLRGWEVDVECREKQIGIKKQQSCTLKKLEGSRS